MCTEIPCAPSTYWTATANGLLCYPMGGTIDGQRGDHVLLAPPFIVSEAEVQTIVDRLATSIDEALAS